MVNKNKLEKLSNAELNCTNKNDNAESSVR